MTSLVVSAPQIMRRVDPVLAALFGIFLGLTMLAPAQAGASLEFTLASLWSILPFLLLSVGVTAYAKASGADNLIARAFQGKAATMVLFAALMGALSPFCSCGVIPLIAALLAIGVPLPPVMAFWLASPLMDPSMFVLTAGTLGMGFAVAKAVAATGVGLLGGFGVLALERAGWLAEPLREGIGDGGCAGRKIRAPKEVVWAFWREEPRRSTFRADAASNAFFLGKWLALAFLLESLMLAWVPQDLISGLAGEDSTLAVMGAALIGVPAYLNGYAALPLVGGLIEQGMAPGAGMAFLLAGGVTSIPAALAVYALARRPVFLAYLGFAFIGAVGAGLAYGLAA